MACGAKEPGFWVAGNAKRWALMSWTNERVKLLEKRWAEGKPASEIAKELGGITRNAVIGKVHRMGLGSRAADSATTSEGKGKKASAAKKAPERKKSAPKRKPTGTEAKKAEKKTVAEKPAPHPSASAKGTQKPIIAADQRLPPQPSANEISAEALAQVRKVEKKAKKISLMELTERTCKWPIGDPATDKFWFCGLAVQQGKPYCEAHVGVAFQPMSARRDRRR